MDLKMSAFIVMQELFLNFRNFIAWYKLFIKGCSQKLYPVLELLSVWQLLQIFLFNEVKPIDLRNTMKVVVIVLIDIGPKVSL